MHRGLFIPALACMRGRRGPVDGRHINGGGVLHSNVDEDDERQGGVDGGGTENAGLLIVSYRRGRMLADIKDPERRAGFASQEAFDRSYGAPIQEA